MATGNTLVQAALRKIGAFTQGETLQPSDAVDGLAELNRMLGAWNAEAGPIFFETLDELTWTAGQSSRTIGVGGNFSVSRPQKILAAYYRSGDIDYEIDVITHGEYQAKPNKLSQTSSPEAIAYNPTNGASLGTLFMYLTPSENIALRLLSLKPLADLTASGTVVLPPGYEDAIVYNLAIRLAPDYGASVKPEIYDLALTSLQNLMSANVLNMLRPLRLDPLSPGAGGSYTEPAHTGG